MKSVVIIALMACSLALTAAQGCRRTVSPPPPREPASYDQSFQKARALFDQGRLEEARVAASAVVTIDDKRWEAYALVAMILDNQGNSAEAKNYLDKALARAPEDKKAPLNEMGKWFKRIAPAAAPSAAKPSDLSKPAAGIDVDCGKGVSMKLAPIPAGEFLMGGDELPEQVVLKCGGREAKAEWFQVEQPQHRVKITKPFYMGVYDVTQAQYEAVMGVNPSFFEGESNPVEQVSWQDAVEFCKKLSAKTGQAVRLPTEAEWEYACRAGTTTPFNTGETISTDQANYDGTATYGSGSKGELRQKTVAVGSFAPNGFGLYDMHGNVWEWCQDWYDAGYYKNSPTDDPPGPETGQSRVVRGGSGVSDPEFCRSASRAGLEPEVRDVGVGFRVVCASRP